MNRNYRNESQDESEVPFGNKKRDWTFIYRATVFVMSAVSSIGAAVIWYAGGSFVRAEASSAANVAVAPLIIDVKELSGLSSKVKRIEDILAERSEQVRDYNVWRSRKDEVDTRLTAILENQQKQLDRQQTLIEQLARR